MIWRQGDILIESITDLPDGVERLKQAVLASGDSTGHRHQIKDRRAAQLYSLPPHLGNVLYLDVTADEATIVHPEHAPIALPRGRYRVWRQREYTERGSRTIRD